MVDLFVTFCELTGSKHSIKTDGRSIAPQIHGKAGPRREWTHQGYKGETIFDGEWRYFIKNGALMDARKLPQERMLSKAELAERKDISTRMRAIYKHISTSGPEAPKAISDY